MKPTLNFFEAIKVCFSKYATFSGRARRSEFWWFYLLGVILNMAFSVLVKWKMAKIAAIESAIYSGVDTNSLMAQAESADTIFYTCAIILCVIGLILFIPMLAAWVRRLHDVGKSGHLLWLILLCGIGGLIPLIMCISDGQPGENQYGPNPKE
ncbi:MAG: DUF805 domain-containing protein [bacterium]|nr:DUF805 domain-containing protein [bacterium]